MGTDFRYPEYSVLHDPDDDDFYSYNDDEILDPDFSFEDDFNFPEDDDDEFEL